MIRPPARPEHVARASRGRRARLTTLSLVGLCGCYGYYAPPTSTAPVGREIQLNLTDSGSFALARVLGPSVVGVQGRLLADSAGSFVVRATGVVQRDGYEAGWKGERIAIARSLVSSTVERRFSRARTTVFTAAITVAVLAIRQAFHGPGVGAAGGVPGQTTPK